MLSCEYCEIFKTPILKIIWKRLLLKVKLNLSKICKSFRVCLKLGNFFSKYCNYLNGCFWKCNIFKHSSNEVASLKFTKKLLSLVITFEMNHISFELLMFHWMVCFNINLIAVFKLNPRATKTSHMWNNHLIFFFCVFIIDIF